jgi:hypothetical protein
MYTNKKFKKCYKFLCLALLSVSPLAHAGAVAEMYACVYLAVKPDSTMVATFKTKNIQCMNRQGKMTETLKLTQKGVSCKRIGEVESQNFGGSCATDHHRWGLTYNIAGTQYSGSTSSEWYFPLIGNATVELFDRTSPTNPGLCLTKDKCSTSSQSFSKYAYPKLYVIFYPNET